MKPYLDNIQNIHLIEAIMYSKELTLAGQTDCIAEYRDKLSVIDFKTANKEKIEDWVDNYFLQCTAYAKMYEEAYGKKIEQIVVLIIEKTEVCKNGLKIQMIIIHNYKKVLKSFINITKRIAKSNNS